MNYASKILTYLADGDRPSQVLLVAGAPPVEKFGEELKIAFNSLLTPDDIRDTLNTFSSHVRRDIASDLGGAGVFSFGMPGVGRFRVHYMTQRGSKIVTIQRMPFDIPRLAALLDDGAQLSLARGLVGPSGGGIVLITGHVSASLASLAYALLCHANDTRKTVICICEENLSFALKHGSSVVIQTEVGTDSPSMIEALESSSFLNPGILYVREPRTRAEFLLLSEAAETGAQVIVSLPSRDEAKFQEDLRARLKDDYALVHRCLLKTVWVTAGAGGKIGLRVL